MAGFRPNSLRILEKNVKYVSEKMISKGSCPTLKFQYFISQYLGSRIRLRNQTCLYGSFSTLNKMIIQIFCFPIISNNLGITVGLNPAYNLTKSNLGQNGHITTVCYISDLEILNLPVLPYRTWYDSSRFLINSLLNSLKNYQF